MLYNTQIKKVLRVLQGENQNTIDTSKVEKVDMVLTPENFNKKIITVHLIVGYNFQFGIFDSSANNGNGGYITPFVNIISGGPAAGGPTGATGPIFT